MSTSVEPSATRNLPGNTQDCLSSLPAGASAEASAGGDHNFEGDSSPRASRDDSVHFLYHGSCKKCHHLHTAMPVRWSTDDRPHSRVGCERCFQVMFGIGCNSTQTTLASVETTRSDHTLDPSIQNHGSDFPGCTNDLPEHLLPNGAPRGYGDLSPIGEGSSLGARSRGSRAISAASSRSPDGAPSGVRSPQDAKSSTASQARDVSTGTKPSQDKTRAEMPSSKKSPGPRLKQWIKSFKPRLTLKKTKKLSLPTLQETPPAPQMKDSATMTERILVEPESRTGQPDETIGDPSSAVVVKRARIKSKRREETLKRKALARPRCACDQRCHCRGGSVGTDPGSDRGGQLNGNPSDISNIPEPPPGFLVDRSDDSSESIARRDPMRTHSPSRFVVDAGTHLDPDHPSSSAEASSSTADVSRRQTHHSDDSTWTSTSTAVDSAGPSMRGTLSRPSSRRSNSMPVAPMHRVDFNQFLERHGYAVRMALRHEGRLNQIEALFGGDSTSASGPSAEESGESSAPAPSVPAPLTGSPSQQSSRGHGETERRSPSHPRSTSLAGLPGPGGDQTAARSERSGTTLQPNSSQTVTPGNGSNARTPQPRSPEDVPPPPPQPGPDEMSAAISYLENHPQEEEHRDEDSDQPDLA